MKFMETNDKEIQKIVKMLLNSNLPKKMREQLENKKDILLNNKTINK